MAVERERWGSDTSISRPVPVDRLSDITVVDLGGMVFGPSGLMLPVDQALAEQRYSPQWGPEATGGRGDG